MVIITPDVAGLPAPRGSAYKITTINWIIFLIRRLFQTKSFVFCICMGYNGKVQTIFVQLYFCGIRLVYACMVTYVHVTVQCCVCIDHTLSFPPASSCQPNDYLA